jgi:sulfatase maturation enzyme AslB (radical SAM superfamily)
MVNAPQFASFEDLENSIWLKDISTKFERDEWPDECRRCRDTESINNKSIRLNAIEFDKVQTKSDYLIVGGILDNLCNSACQTCGPNNSTKIAGLKGEVIRIRNTDNFWKLPQERIVHLDINGGEPSYSPDYKEILNNLPPNVASIRLNTNCTTVLDELIFLANKGIDITVTVSFDGVESIHEYLRWPIKWDNFLSNLMTYKAMPINLNLWTTVSALNIGDLKNIISFAEKNKFNHSWALLEQPDVYNVRYRNFLTQKADVPEELKSIVSSGSNNNQELLEYINKQDALRKIDIKDYIK